MKRPLTLQGRLALLLLITVPTIWLIATAIAAYATHEEIDELYDTQLSQFARQLLIVNMGAQGDQALPVLPKTKKLIHGGDKGEADDDDVGVAVWNGAGELLLSNGKGRYFDYDAQRRGFYTVSGQHGKHGQQAWRLFYLPAPDGSRLVAVGQRASYRHKVVWEVIKAQLLPWLIGFPILLFFILWSGNKGLRPLKKMAQNLQQRSPLDRSPLSEDLPGELRPIVQALNTLFARIAQTVEYERRFTADAAHELRTPLTALKVQAEVMALLPDAPAKDRALAQLQLGIDRATHLVTQLLALSRLDPLAAPSHCETIHWPKLGQDAIADVQHLAQEKSIQIDCQTPSEEQEILPLMGDATLLTLLLRNLLDNAIRYSPPHSKITLQLSPHEVAILDNGPGIDPQWLSQVHERFFRPPGQDASGSGLGLSIVQRIAELHGLRLILENRPEGGLAARLCRV